MPNRTVLLVEDDDTFRYTAARHLERAGYRVVQAKNTFEALKLAEAGLLAKFLIADVMMPTGIPHGIALANMLTSRRVTQRVFFVTGFSEAADAAGELWSTGSVYRKPVDLERLTAEIEADSAPFPI